MASTLVKTLNLLESTPLHKSDIFIWGILGLYYIQLIVRKEKTSQHIDKFSVILYNSLNISVLISELKLLRTKANIFARYIYPRLFVEQIRICAQERQMV